MWIERLLWAAVAPLGLLLLSSVWSYPVILEEIVKGGVLRLAASGQRVTLKEGALVGFVFGISEAVLFSFNAWSGGQWQAIVMRLLLTVPMHLVTGAVIGAGMERDRGYLGILLAMIIHLGFNGWVGAGKFW